MFETPESESAFLDVADGMEGLDVADGMEGLDVADGMEGLDVITGNAEALGKHGVLGEAWILPPPHSLDRAPLARLYPVA